MTNRHARSLGPASYRAGGAVVAAVGLSVAIDQAVLGAATAEDRTRVLLGTAVAAVGLATAASSHLLLRRPHQGTTNGQGAGERVIIVSALLIALIRGLPQLLDLVDHVQADRDEPITTMVHVVRLLTTASLAAGLLVVARARPHR